MTGHTAGTHKRIRLNQKGNTEEYHHPQEKIAQLQKLSCHFFEGDTLEVFGGQGNLTQFYTQYGRVTSMTKEEFGNSFNAVYVLRGQNKKYNTIDIDSYGYPDLFFPVVFEMMKDKCLLIFTFPIVGVNALNVIMEQHFITFWRSARPTLGDVVGIITDMALRNWMLVSLVDVVKIKRIWRFVLTCKRVKATEMCNVKNA